MPNPWDNQQQAPAGGNPFPQQQTHQGQQQPTWGGGAPAGQQGQQSSPQPPSIGDALAGGGAQTAFDQNTPIGVVIQGTIVSRVVQQTKFNPRFWDDGNPKWIIVVTVENAMYSMGDGQQMQPLRTAPDDDGKRSFYIKTWGDNFRALQDAIKTTGHTDAEQALAPGVPFSGKHTGRERSSQGGNDELLYAYHIGAVAAGPTGAAPQPAQQQAPAAQPQQQAPAQSAQQAPWPAPAQGEEPPF